MHSLSLYDKRQASAQMTWQHRMMPVRLGSFLKACKSGKYTTYLNKRAEPAAVVHKVLLLLVVIDCLQSDSGGMWKDVFVWHGRHG